jgi:hypothetical protein
LWSAVTRAGNSAASINLSFADRTTARINRMAIDVVCDCGKRLKAPDWMAGRSTQCPACWNAVQIPKPGLFGVLGRRSKKKRRRGRSRSAEKESQPSETAPSAETPMPLRGGSIGGPVPSSRSSFTPQPRPKTNGRKTTFVPSRAVGDGDEYRPDSIMLRRQPRWVKLLPARREQHWYDSLVIPLGKFPIFLRLGLLQAVLTTATLIFWLSMDRDNPIRGQLALFFMACLGGVFFVMGHTFHYFNAILEMACHGKTKHEPGIGCTSLGAMVSCGHWLSCFLTGPLFFFVAALGYWLYCGDLSIVDWSILVELCLAGVGWGLIALLLTNLDDKVRVASPIEVLRTAFTMPWECAGLTILAAAVFLGHVFVAAYALGQLHVSPLSAFPLLWACWSSGFYLTAFTFRRLGLTYYRAQQRIKGRKQTRAVPVAVATHQGGIPGNGACEQSSLA